VMVLFPSLSLSSPLSPSCLLRAVVETSGLAIAREGGIFLGFDRGKDCGLGRECQKAQSLGSRVHDRGGFSAIPISQ
jgi:hypothetical protein